MLGLLAVANAVLTLPGIAGFVLSIGMAVDANVLIFERLKEELWAGQDPARRRADRLRARLLVGFRQPLHDDRRRRRPLLARHRDGKGFAYTLFWGTVFSLVTAVFVTRFFIDVIVENDLVTNQKAYGA